MDPNMALVEKLKSYGVGQRKLDDVLFVDDKPPPRLGIYDVDDENLCHEVITSTCNIPGCVYTTDSLLDFENHYNASHRYACSQCKRVLASPHLLDLHLQERHDSFFAVMATKKPSYSCYIEECKEKFMTAEIRFDHCVKIHKLPKDFRFEQKPKSHKKNKKEKHNQISMEVDTTPKSDVKIFLTNNKQKTFSKYTGKKFTKNNTQNSTVDVNMDEVIDDLKKSLPE